MAVKHNSEAHSSTHCCRGKAIIITCSECVFVGLVIQYSMHMTRYILIGGLSACTTFSHII
jgi:hypothetical protein